MSTNNFFLIEDNLDFFIFFGMAKIFKEKILSKQTLEGSIQHEASFLDYIKITEGSTFDQIVRVDETQELLTNNYGFNVSLLNRKFIGLFNTLNFLEDVYYKEFAEISFLLESVKGKIKRISQKKAALNLWKENISFLHLENFLNVDYLKIGAKNLNFNHDMGVATLPILRKEPVLISSLFIQSGNGRAGNSDLDVNADTQNLENIIDGKEDTYFEYEKLDSGPLQLCLEFKLQGDCILNSMEIVPFLDEENLGFEIEDILFFKKNNKTVSIKKLCGRSSFFVDKEAGEEYTIDFLPIKCDSFAVKIKQENGVEVLKSRRLRERKRERFSIGLKKINPISQKYAKEGSCYSKEIPLQVQCFAGEVETEIFPKQKDLYSMDNGVYCEGAWKETKDNELFLLSGEESFFKWRGSLERKDEEFKNKSSYEDNLSELIYKKKVVNKKINPCNFTFEGEVKEENVSVFCDTGLNRTSKNKRYKVLKYIKSDTMKLNIMVDGVQATPDGLYIKVDIPISLKDLKIDKEEFGISVNNVDYEQVFAEEDLSNANYFISYGENCILFLKDLFPSRGRIRWYLMPEQLRFFSKSDYIYSKFRYNFDPDKEKIDIFYLSSIRRAGEFSLVPGRKRFFLEKNGIEKESIVIKSSESFTEVSTLLDLKNYNLSGYAYYFDEKSSVLHINDFLDRSSLAKVSFYYREKEKLSNEDYEIWEEKSRPIGIKILRETFKSETVNQKLFEANQKVFSNVLNESVERTKTLDNSTTSGAEKRAFELAYDNIIKHSFVIDKNILINPYDKNFKEKTYIDGNTEFLGLTHVEDEFTNEILSSIGTVTFSLGARSLFYKAAGIIFEDGGEYFPSSQEQSSVSAVTALGDWFVSDDGDVTVFVGANNRLPKNIRYSYFYRRKNSQNQGNFFSVDYENSIIYFSTDVLPDENAFITYNVSNYISEYDILKKVKDYDVDFSNKKVTINSSEFLLGRGMCFLFYKKNLFNYNLEEVREYFSPLLYSLRFKFK